MLDRFRKLMLAIIESHVLGIETSGWLSVSLPTTIIDSDFGPLSLAGASTETYLACFETNRWCLLSKLAWHRLKSIVGVERHAKVLR